MVTGCTLLQVPEIKLNKPFKSFIHTCKEVICMLSTEQIFEFIDVKQTQF